MGLVWAITRLTLIRTLRQKTAAALIFCVLAAGPGLSLFLEGGLGLGDLIKTVLTFNVAIASVAMMLLTLYLSTSLIHRDLVDKQVFMVDTKPAARWQVLLGTWLGLAILLAWLLLLAGVGAYLAALAFASAGRWTVWAWARALFFWLFVFGAGGGLLALAFARIRQTHPYARPGYWWAAAALLLAVCCWRMAADIRSAPRLMDRRGADIGDVWRQLLVARQSFTPPSPDLAKAMADRRRQLEAEGNTFDKWKTEQLNQQLHEDVAKNTWRIPFRGRYTFTFEGLPKAAEGKATEFMVRYQFHLVGGGFGQAGWVLARGDGSGFGLMQATSFKSGRPEEFVADYTVAGDTGRLDVAIENLGKLDTGESTTIFVPLYGGIELLVPTGTFGGNMAKAYFLLWIRLAMLAAFGLLANAFLGGPVSALFLFWLMVMGLANSTVIGWFTPDLREYGNAPMLKGEAHDLAMGVLHAGMGVFPDFDQTDPTGDLLAGREITWWRILRQLLLDLGIRGGLALGLASWLYSRREVGMPTYV